MIMKLKSRDQGPRGFLEPVKKKKKRMREMREMRRSHNEMFPA
jgi:hypothetical protein